MRCSQAAWVRRSIRRTARSSSRPTTGATCSRTKETLTVDRPAKAVSADLAEFAKKCLDIKVNTKRAARYALDKYGSGTGGGAMTYNTAIGMTPRGTTALAAQESGTGQPEGLPPGGMYTVVVEV